MMTKDIRNFVAAIRILPDWHRKRVLSMMAPMSLNQVTLDRKKINSLLRTTLCAVSVLQYACRGKTMEIHSEGSENAVRARPGTRRLFEPVDSKRKAACWMVPRSYPG